jgi:serine/threonine protein kinase
MIFKPGVQALRAKYQLVKLISSDENSETWVAFDDDSRFILLKLWPFEGTDPDPLQRALWDSELRTLYRVGSSPGADNTLVVIRDARVDRELGAFVMALKGRGYDSLSEALRVRSQLPWFSTKDLSNRRLMWEGILRLARGLNLLHEQRVIHRNIAAENVFLSIDEGPETFRLGGFEWSIRLGVPAKKKPPENWSAPPEFFDQRAVAYSPETDWFSFGMLLARCLLKVEPHAQKSPHSRFTSVLEELDRATAKELSDLEKLLLRRLIFPDPIERLFRFSEIERTISEIIELLDQHRDVGKEHRALILVVDPAKQNLVDKCLEGNYLPNPDAPSEPFNPNNKIHVARLTEFIRKDLRQSQLYAMPAANYFILNGGILTVRITQFTMYRGQGEEPKRSWDLAYLADLAQIRGAAASQIRDLPNDIVTVMTLREAYGGSVSRQDTRSWQEVLPRVDESTGLQSHLSRFHDFVRCTNQLELLVRVGEIFTYKLISHELTVDGLLKIIIEETLPDDCLPSVLRNDEGMIDYLFREVESNKPHSREVALTSTGALTLYFDKADPHIWWEVDSIDTEGKKVTLLRQVLESTAVLPPSPGNLRAFGWIGQIALIQRRKDAIDRLKNHSYLLLSLASPGQVVMDTGDDKLPVSLPEYEVDESKQAAIRDILRVRPIYALQGPPGTGKTTLLAYLLREILEDDPVAQVLVTAQAHGAVDVLRNRVEQIFNKLPLHERPLAVRFGGGGPEERKEGSILDVARNVLEVALEQLTALPTLSDLQIQWMAIATEMLGSLATGSPTGDAADFCELVKHGSNITYCTTSDAELDSLAKGAQSFDWSIVEEAGRAHGFDLALPLQAGHRWLLIGDHKQLPPYHIRVYREAMEKLDEAVIALRMLPRSTRLVDYEWLHNWSDRSAQERSEFRSYALSWLKTFERIFYNCSNAFGQEVVTRNESCGAAAGQLSWQHRMHPHIGDLISWCYYDHELHNKTLVEGVPVEKVVHPLIEPQSLIGKAIVWLDLPWASKDNTCKELGPAENVARFRNPSEFRAIAHFLRDLKSSGPIGEPLELAVLSPYSQQVAFINSMSDKLELPAGIVKKPNMQWRSKRPGRAAERTAYTVDSFQGNQADIIVVSLVRNNKALPLEGLGFLDEGPRLNVLFSRAERLLILVGSWEFFLYQVSLVSEDDKRNVAWHWRKALDTLAGWFESGAALRVPANFG